MKRASLLKARNSYENRSSGVTRFAVKCLLFVC
jgi:hypothetical protein